MTAWNAFASVNRREPVPLMLHGDAHHSDCEGELRMWPLPVIERARRQDSKIGPPSSPCGLVVTFLGRRMLCKVSQLENCQDLLIDAETWQAISDPNTADDLARGLFMLKAAIDSGPEGAREASAIILANIESAYLHTNAHKAALKLYLLSLTGHLKPEDEPLQLINGAIQRGMARIELMGQGRAREKGRR